MEKPLKTRQQLKSESKALLKGHWKSAILVSLLAILIFIVYSRLYSTEYTDIMNLYSTENNNQSSAISPIISATVVVLYLIFQILLVGVSYTFLTWVSSQKTPEHAFTQSFQVFSNELFFPSIGIAILKTIYSTLWTLLLFVPGIIKYYSYSQVFMINKDLTDNPNHPDISINKKITLSRELMNGHKFDLFVIELSLVGWYLLSIVTLGIGYIWYMPYQQAIKANFYRDLAGDKFLTLK